jgi:hypothetical protein
MNINYSGDAKILLQEINKNYSGLEMVFNISVLFIYSKINS